MRGLVKMSSSKVSIQEATDGICQRASHVKVGQGSSEVVNDQPSTVLPQQHKKKVRRRLHTSRPYQERLLNMAEARREIVTALKFHRASMKQQQLTQQRKESLPVVHQPPLQILSSPSLDLVTELGMNSAKSRMIYPSDGGLIFPSSSDSYRQPWTPFTYNNSSATVPSDSIFDNSGFSFPLPSQTLGLNLNIQDLSNLRTSPFQNNPSLFTSPPSSLSSPAMSATTTEEIHSAADYTHNGAFQTNNMGTESGGMSPYPAMDREVMKEIKSMGDCYDMVWNDTMNSLTSAWWLKYSKAAEMSPDLIELKRAEDEHLSTPLSELPRAWLNPADSYFPSHLNVFCPEDSSPDLSLPCIEIGEIEGVDGDWFA